MLPVHTGEMVRSLFVNFCSIVAVGSLSAKPLERWVYAPVNHLVPEEITRVEDLMRRARGFGYTHFLLADSKFSRLEEMEPRYFANLNRVKRTAKELGLKVVPAVFPVGYSNDMLGHDPNLAEGLPVRDALFVVRDGAAHVVDDPPVSLPPLAERQRWSFIDDLLKPDDGGVRLENGGDANARASIKVKVAPWRHYHASVELKTNRFTGTPEIKVLTADGRSLSYTSLKAAGTQDWTTHHVTFNSLAHEEVAVYFGVWGAGQGRLWMRAPRLEEAGPVNLLRRKGCPLVVKDENGRALVEGVDFNPLSDPRLGNQPYGGEYEVWHDPPPLKTPLPDGSRLRVSYYHTHIVHDGQVTACVSEPAFMDLLRHQAHDVRLALAPDAWMMSHDEWRVLGWDEASTHRHLTPGAIVADNARRCTGFLREVDPTGRIHVWSDMFDPHHNAVESYYLVNGPLTNAWEGLNRDVIIMNWNFDHRVESLKFFADRGHSQIIAGFYDNPLSQFDAWLEAARNVKGVIGVMYTTWNKNYEELDAFAQKTSAWETPTPTR